MLFIIIIGTPLIFLMMWLGHVIPKFFEKEPPDVEEVVEEEPIVDFLDVKLTEDYLTLDNYIGQTKSIEYLKGHIKKAKNNVSPLPHIILWGGGGLGKSTLVKSVAYEMGGRFIEIIPANLRTTKDLFSILFKKTCYNCGHTNPFSSTKCLLCKNDIKIYFEPFLNIQESDIIFLEECHGLKVDIEEALYSLMQDKYIMLRYNGIDQRVEFPDITIAGATTRLGDLNKPFRDRFKIDIQLQPYSEEDIMIISDMYSKSRDYNTTEEALKKVAIVSYGVPRIAKKYLDDSSTRGDEVGEKEINEILELLNIDENGLGEIHRKILKYIHTRGQAGHTSIASSVGLGSGIYLEVYEPALMYKNLIWQGNRGRILTDLAKKTYFPNCECKQCNK